MTLDELEKSLYNLNEIEVFYKNYYNAKKDKNTLNSFLKNVNLNFVLKNNLHITELNIPYTKKFEESWFFNENSDYEIVIQKHNCYSPDFSHYHNFFEMIYVLDGHCEHNVSGYDFSMSAGDICIISPNIEHTISVFDESVIIDILIKRSTFEDIFFNLLTGDNILSSFFINNIYSKHINDYIIFHTNKDPDIKSMLMELFLESINKESYYREILNSELIRFFGKMLRKYENNYELPPLTKKKDLQSYSIIQYIENNYKNVTLNDIARQFHYSEEHTSRLIKSITGYTFCKLHTKIRMDRAASYLKSTSSTIQDISDNVGYLNPEHFIRTFKKEYGMTPTQYRKKSKIIENPH